MITTMRTWNDQLVITASRASDQGTHMLLSLILLGLLTEQISL